jgi:hypothetical protein
MAVIEKSFAVVPASLVMANPVRSASPVFLIVNVRLVLLPVSTLPKSLEPPSAIVVPAGCSTVILAAAMAAPVDTARKNGTASNLRSQ